LAGGFKGEAGLIFEGNIQKSQLDTSKFDTSKTNSNFLFSSTSSIVFNVKSFVFCCISPNCSNYAFVAFTASAHSHGTGT